VETDSLRLSLDEFMKEEYMRKVDPDKLGLGLQNMSDKKTAYKSFNDFPASEIARADGHLWDQDPYRDFKPSQILYVDDRLRYVLAAADKGMNAVWYRKPDVKMEDELNTIKYKNHFDKINSIYVIDNIDLLNPLKN
jgi:hypothetical protein